MPPAAYFSLLQLDSHNLEGKVVERGRRKTQREERIKGRQQDTHKSEREGAEGRGEKEVPLEGEEPEEVTRTLPSPFTVCSSQRLPLN